MYVFYVKVEKDDRSASELDTVSEDEAISEPGAEAFKHKHKAAVTPMYSREASRSIK